MICLVPYPVLEFLNNIWGLETDLPTVSTTPVVHLELRISPRVFEKIRNSPNGIIRDFGKLIHVENLKLKIS
jgi:hypothetical protein